MAVGNLVHAQPAVWIHRLLRLPGIRDFDAELLLGLVRQSAGAPEEEISAGPIETDGDFHKRLNKNARDEDEGAPSKDTSGGEWYLGPEARDRGSVHSDYMFEVTGADLAERNVVAVYPVTGWWKELKKRDRSEHGARYALVVTIETDEVDADIWTPIANQVGIPIAVET